jgi:hypothetical protein
MSAPSPRGSVPRSASPACPRSRHRLGRGVLRQRPPDVERECDQQDGALNPAEHGAEAQHAQRGQPSPREATADPRGRALPGTTAIMAEMPRISRILAMLEPTTLPTAIPGDPPRPPTGRSEAPASTCRSPAPPRPPPPSAAASASRRRHPPRTRPSRRRAAGPARTHIMIASIARPTPVAPPRTGGASGSGARSHPLPQGPEKKNSVLPWRGLNRHSGIPMCRETSRAPAHGFAPEREWP